MSWLFDTIKGRVLALLVLFFSLSHVIGLWLSVQKNEEATTRLHHALLAEQVALLSRLSDRLRPEERSGMFEGQRSHAASIANCAGLMLLFPTGPGSVSPRPC